MISFSLSALIGSLDPRNNPYEKLLFLLGLTIEPNEIKLRARQDGI